MKFLENRIEERSNPGKLIPGAHSVISLASLYRTPDQQNKDCSYRISKYAYGNDYHSVVLKKTKELSRTIAEASGSKPGACFVDSGTLFEKKWAALSGIGWIGKNTLLVHPQAGSYLFLSEIITDLELDYDEAMPDQCGTCTSCIRACPTGALALKRPYTLNPSLCISYQTIEQEEGENFSFSQKNKEWIFGCDLCQEACPNNKKPVFFYDPDFSINPAIKNFTDTDWNTMNKSEFDDVFKDSTLKRGKLERIKRNIRMVVKNRSQL